MLYCPVIPVRNGGFRQSISRIMRGAPLSEKSPDRITAKISGGYQPSAGFDCYALFYSLFPIIMTSSSII